MLRHFIPRNDNRVAAFTLAEVLITLTIIGVIAALTIPNLIAKHEKEQTVIKLKKVYTTLNDAFSKIEMEDPDFFESVPSPYDARVWTALDQKLREHLNIYAKCNSRLGDTITSACVYPQYYTLKGDVENNSPTVTSNAYIILADGTYIYFGNQGGSCGFATSITVDLNGAKKPNTFGKDTFVFRYLTYKAQHGSSVMYSKPRIVPRGPEGSILYCNPTNYSRNLLISENQTHACTKNGTGLTCAALIIKDGWKISDDYPW